eukprot:Selendium_serpulae@DN3586_c0_g1_i2.p1
MIVSTTSDIKVVERTWKELKYYHDEVNQQRQALEKMKEDKQESGRTKQQQNCIEETLLVIKTTEKRLTTGAETLDEFLATKYASEVKAKLEGKPAEGEAGNMALLDKALKALQALAAEHPELQLPPLQCLASEALAADELI